MAEPALAIRNCAVGSALSMAKGFGRYKPEEEKAVRKVEVAGDELSYLRQRREMLRSMTPEQALQVIEFHKGLNVFQALELAKKQGKLIVPNDVHDRILTETDAKYTVWTGTMTVYEEQGTPFGKAVEYTDRKTRIRLVFPVPDEFIGVKNGLLVVEHPDFTLEADGNNRIVRAVNVSLVKDFPTEDGWHLTDPAHDIPFGRKTDSSNPDARLLWRARKKRVRLVTRGAGYGGCGGKVVDVHGSLSGAFGVALF
ncbi:hypothetical protein H0O00_00790 [Candidatus Micrarchaeota archaeon]|nr:hypothetical protein [Candidatus Micrarchaeota archaeon]